MITVRHGRRPVVARLTTTAVEDFFAATVRRDPRNLLDLLEVRRPLKVEIAALAARRVSRIAAAEAMRAHLAQTERSLHAALELGSPDDQPAQPASASPPTSTSRQSG